MKGDTRGEIDWTIRAKRSERNDVEHLPCQGVSSGQRRIIFSAFLLLLLFFFAFVAACCSLAVDVCLLLLLLLGLGRQVPVDLLGPRLELASASRGARQHRQAARGARLDRLRLAHEDGRWRQESALDRIGGGASARIVIRVVLVLLVQLPDNQTRGRVTAPLVVRVRVQVRVQRRR